MFVFCPSSACASKITYEAIKPTVCPFCKKAFSAAFKVSVPTPVVSTSQVEKPDYPDIRPVPSSVAKWKARKNAAAAVKQPIEEVEPHSHIMNAPDVPEDMVLDDSTGDENEEDTNPSVVRRRARELAASIDPSTIQINDDDEGTFKFESFWNEGAKAREAGVKVGKVSKRSRRR